MKTKHTPSLAVCALVALIFPLSASADRPHSDRYSQRYEHRDYHRDDYREHHHHDHDRGRRGWSNAATAAVILGTVGALAWSSSPAPQRVIIASPPPPVYVPPRPPQVSYWYYCGSAGQYYPYVSYCPEGWQAVLPR